MAIYMSNLAPKASPSLTGVPRAPTAATGTTTTQIATTAFVKNNGGGGVGANQIWDTYSSYRNGVWYTNTTGGVLTLAYQIRSSTLSNTAVNIEIAKGGFSNWFLAQSNNYNQFVAHFFIPEYYTFKINLTAVYGYYHYRLLNA